MAKKVKKVSDTSTALAKAVGSIDGFKFWSDVSAPPIMPTRITSFNRALRTGGLPGGLLGVLHGPSQGGKTLLLSEIIRSAWATGGWGLFVDAECRAVDLKWFSTICHALDEVIYYKPMNFEDCILRVEKIRTAFRAAKVARGVPPGAFLCVGVDSVNRLTPKNELKDLTEGKAKERGYPIRAMMISSWLDTLIPTLMQDEIVVFIQRESVNIGALPGQRTWQTKGGRAPGYDGGWVARVTAVGKVREDTKAGSALVGEKHEVQILKNSMGPKLDELAYFYSSIGAVDQSPLGFDFPREVREEAIKRELVKQLERKDLGKGFYYKDAKVAANKPALLRWLLEEDSTGEKLNWEVLAEELEAEFK